MKHPQRQHFVDRVPSSTEFPQAPRRGARLVPTYAPFSLVRAVLENSCAAVWMLQPPRRTERITRRLQFAVTDIRNGEEAKERGGQGDSPAARPANQAGPAGSGLRHRGRRRYLLELGQERQRVQGHRPGRRRRDRARRRRDLPELEVVQRHGARRFLADLEWHGPGRASRGNARDRGIQDRGERQAALVRHRARGQDDRPRLRAL